MARQCGRVNRSLAGKTFEVRFWFDTGDDLGNRGAGWFIDDLVASETEPTSPF